MQSSDDLSAPRPDDPQPARSMMPRDGYVPTRPSQPPPPKRLILVVEDDPGVRETTSEVLEIGGYRVQSADNGPRALSAVKQERPALILLDLSLPILDGWEVLEELQAQGDPPPVILVTGHIHLAGRAMESGAAASIIKPYDMDDLLGLVAKVLDPPARSGLSS